MKTSIEVSEFTKKQAELCAKDLIRARCVARERIGLLRQTEANNCVEKYLKTVAQEVDENLPYQKKLSDPDYSKEMKELFEKELARQYKMEQLYKEILTIVNSCKKTLNERFLESKSSKEDAIDCHKRFIGFACERILPYEKYEELEFEKDYTNWRLTIMELFNSELEKN